MYRKRILGDGGGIGIKIEIILNSGVSSITVNGKTYNYSTAIWVDRGENITWSATSSLGYRLNTSSGTINNIQESTAISPETTYVGYLTVTITIYFNVSSITVNGTRYTSSTTKSFLYGTLISWSAVAESNYRLSSSSGSFTLTSAQTIAPTATYSGNCVVTITINDGIDYITVNGTKYTSSTTKTFSGGTKVTWTATAKSGYAINYLSSGSYTCNAPTYEISPTATYKGSFTVSVSSIDSGITLKVGGTTRSAGWSGTYVYGSTVTVSVSGSSDAFYVAYSWNGYNRNWGGYSGKTSYTGTETVYENSVIKAYFSNAS